MSDLLPADELQRLRLATLGTDGNWLPGTARTSVTVSDLRYALECIETANRLWHDAIVRGHVCVYEAGTCRTCGRTADREKS